METISLRLDPKLARIIEQDMEEHNYSTKTEYIREAIRTKHSLLEDDKAKKKAWEALYASRGSLKGQGKSKTDAEFRKLTEKAGEEFIEILEKRFAQK